MKNYFNISSTLNQLNSLFSSTPAAAVAPIKGYNLTDNGLSNLIIPRNGIIPGAKILYLGLNGSVITHKRKPVDFNTDLQNEDIRTSLDSKNRLADILLGKVAHINYFKMLRKITHAIGEQDFSYVDMLFIRLTDSKLIKGALLKAYNSNSLFKQFIAKQLEISVDLIKKSGCKVIILNNALASQLLPVDKYPFTTPEPAYEPIRNKLEELLGGKLILDEATSSYIWTYNDKEIHVFLSAIASVSMCSFSIDRLVMDVKRVL